MLPHFQSLSGAMMEKYADFIVCKQVPLISPNRIQRCPSHRHALCMKSFGINHNLSTHPS